MITTLTTILYLLAFALDGGAPENIPPCPTEDALPAIACYWDGGENHTGHSLINLGDGSWHIID